MSVKNQKIITAFSSVDPDNVHVAIAAEIAAELWQRHPNIHFQTTGPAKERRIPGEPHPITAAAITFKFAKTVLYCDKMQDLNHIGTIIIDRGICTVKVEIDVIRPDGRRERHPVCTDPVSSSYNSKAYLVERQWPLEFPGFPEIIYDHLAPILNEAVGDSKKQGVALEFLYEVKKKRPPHPHQHWLSVTPADARAPARHLAERFDTDPVVTLCGQRISRADLFSIDASIDYTRDGKYCSNCRESRIYKARRGEL